MNQDPRLERYLASLERVLKPFPVSDRAEIVTEIKSHVLSALERDPNAQLDTVLAAIGEPEIVANRYLLERGMKPTKPPISPIVKWLVIGFLGTMAMFFIFAGFLVSKVSPLVQVDEKHDQVSLLGGFIKIDGSDEDITINGKSLKDAGRSSGSADVATGQKISVRFSTGKFDISTGEDGKLSWECSGLGPDSVKAKPQEQALVLDLTTYLAAKCELQVPEGAKFSIVGGNAKVEIDEPRFDVDASVGNAKVVLHPADDQEYRYDLKVENGKIAKFESSKDAKAHLIKINVANGKIARDKDED